MGDLAFIIQARLGSTRLPNKILLPFCGQKGIFELMLDKLAGIRGADCIVATSTAPVNDTLEAICRARNVPCYRGAEQDVLQRFIEAARRYGKTRIIRVCSDNPFLNVPAIEALIARANMSDADYIGFDVAGTPAIKTHYGFWTEYVTLAALQKAAACTQDALYHEHVTNYIYTHPEDFRLEWLPVPPVVLENRHVRLTIDTAQDFDAAREIYAAIADKNSFEALFRYINARPRLVEGMVRQIANNSK
ncbi:MAG: glycosyl transferase family 2 [Bacteroidales bacterium]|nr:glycosyl transferase family 2 [Bacteroidales bacterium]